jgi:hypothetical protein
MRRDLATALVAAGAVFLGLALFGLVVADLDNALVLGLIGVAFAVAGARGLGGSAAEAPAAAPRVPPVPAAAAEVDLDALPRPFHACARCGYLGAHPRKLDEGGIPGWSEMQGMYACDRCGHHGLPVAFDAPEAYRNFLRELAAQA